MRSAGAGARHDALMANEGHVGDILLLNATERALEQSTRPLGVGEIVATLFQAGFPRCNEVILAWAIRTVLRQHPETFAKARRRWRLQI